jgi:hypothetical protein
MGTVGGAAIVGDAISGAASAYVGVRAPSLGGVAAGPRLLVRLVRRATDTTLSFSYRLVAADFVKPFPSSFPGFIAAGSVGRPVTINQNFPNQDAGGVPPTQAPRDPAVLLGAVHTLQFQLGDAFDGELVLLIRPWSPADAGGILIDNVSLQ